MRKAALVGHREGGTRAAFCSGIAIARAWGVTQSMRKEGGEGVELSLKAARVNAGLKQSEVCEQLGIARGTLSRWESGKGTPRLKQLIMLCGMYGVKAEDIRI